MVPGKDLIELKMIFNCDLEAPSCIAQAGRSLGVQKLIYGSVSAKPGAKSNVVWVSLKLLDVGSGTIERVVSESPLRRDVTSQPAELASRWLLELLLIAPKPTLSIVSDPPGAQIKLDGKTVGIAPLQLRNLQPGMHNITFSMPGRAPAVRTVDLRTGGAHEVSVALDPDDVTPPPPGPAVARPSTPPAKHVTSRAEKRMKVGNALRISGGVLIGLAAVSGIAAIVLYTQYTDLQNSITAQIYNPDPMYRDFFKKPDCNLPAGLGSAAMRDQYVSDCNHGGTLADATTATWITAAALAVPGIVLLGVGQYYVSHASRADRAALRMPSFTPYAGTTGAGLVSTVRF
jgi:hypothetical protein